MNTSQRFIVGALVALGGVLTQSASADLTSDIRRAIRSNELDTARVAVSVLDLDTGRSLVDINADLPMIPASNMKLLTAGTALHVLGPDFEFRTRLVLSGDRLVVIGDGDPGFGDPELLRLVQFGDREGIDIETLLSLWVDAVSRADVSRISELTSDDRVFDRQFIHETWPEDQLNRWYCAEVSGLNFHLNVLHFYPRPQSVGPPDVSQFEPYASWLDLSRNRATSNAATGNTMGIARPFQTNNLTFFGNVSRAYAKAVPVTVHDVPTFFARLLGERLRARGIAVDRVGAVSPNAQAVTGTTIGPTIRTPISTAVTRCNRDSQNLYAEALIKRSGYALTRGAQPGSWANGAAAVRFAINQRVSDPSVTRGLLVADGSGMSRDNRVTARLMTEWLESFHNDEELGAIFIDSLAVGGVSGTLDSRFRGAEFDHVTVQAKTGYIKGVSCLSGYITTQDGRRCAFSVLVNDIIGGTQPAKQLQETVAALVAARMGSLATVDIGG